MTKPHTEYVLSDHITDAAHKALGVESRLLAQLLHNRGMTTADAATAFLNPQYENDLHDPFLLTDMARAVSRVHDAIEKNEYVAIYSDYDCDGIPGGVVLHDLFHAVGFTHFENYIPHRHREGFGLNADAVRTLAERDTTLIITIDCGTLSHEAIAVANELGIDVIVTDHHEPGDTLPDAYAVLNPKRDDAYPFKGLCGAGVVYKFVQAFLQFGKEKGTVDLSEGKEKWFLDMVGVATIADMVPLVGENRAFAHYGLHVLRKSRRPGLQHLFRKTRTDQRRLTEDDIGFTIGPRINAASRMDTPEDAFHLLATTDEGDAGARAAHLEKLNNERKGVVAAMSKELKKRIEKFDELPPVIVLGNPSWKPSLVGLSANSLVDTYKRPVFLWGRDGQGVIKGSCRSDGETSVVSLMEKARDTFLEFGGHHGSGGFSVSDDVIHTLADALNDAHAALGNANEKTEHTVIVDADCTLEEVTPAFVKTLSMLAPYGEGNPKPLFRFRNVVPKDVAQFGKTKEHLKLTLDTAGSAKEAIAFFSTPESYQAVPEAGKPVTLIAHVEESFFMNRPQIRLRIVDVI